MSAADDSHPLQDYRKRAGDDALQKVVARITSSAQRMKTMIPEA